MNKKGFTLIELLCTIAIMGIIATIASINLVKIYQNKNNEKVQIQNNIIETAACIYIELQENTSLKDNCLTNGCDISTDTLITNGLIDEKDVDNPKIIHIFKENNTKQCKIKE